MVKAIVDANRSDGCKSKITYHRLPIGVRSPRILANRRTQTLLPYHAFRNHYEEKPPLTPQNRGSPPLLQRD